MNKLPNIITTHHTIESYLKLIVAFPDIQLFVLHLLQIFIEFCGYVTKYNLCCSNFVLFVSTNITLVCNLLKEIFYYI